jgi:transposase-like protein
MKDKITISTFQFAQMFPDTETARKYLEGRLWPEGVVCPFCQKKDRIAARKGGFYRCNACLQDFTVRTGTIFERSHVPLNKWLYAMYLLLTSRKGISSLQLSKELGITQKSAWFLLHRLREACGDDMATLQGIIEVDETFIGGKETNRHANKKLYSKGTQDKQAVLGMRERGGKAVARPIPNRTAEVLTGQIKKHVWGGSTVHTDDHAGYNDLDPRYFQHESVNHRAKEYVRGSVHTNGIESVWAVLKRGIYGVYHHTSTKHLQSYLDEFAFRLNEGNCKVPTLDRIVTLIEAGKGKRLTYSKLISE